ncbi:hypothetical protein DM860_001723 [Cuscuta australis]|uniref:Uncharacterized protein n=1 Tax=Cuscuta australis TaxID=267555 RepID=A0A328E959_9ASTE|nr:hypothetical protein DM860_001723 [Cuscuta australis]
MGMVIVMSLPLILFSLLLGFGCYVYGRWKGRKEVYASAQVFGAPAPPPAAALSPPHFKHDSASAAV